MFATFSHKGAAIICAIPIKLIDNHVTRSNAVIHQNINLELIYSQVTRNWFRTLQVSNKNIPSYDVVKINKWSSVIG